jgi:glutamine synthetase
MAKSRRILEELEDDSMVKVAGVDVDGILRGKIMAKKKFASIVNDGFGFCSVIFGWDMHDQLYARELKVSNKENGYRDVIAVPDVKSFRRIPWEDNVPLFLVDFVDPDTQKPVCACSRSLLKTVLGRLQAQGMTAMAGGKRFLQPCCQSLRNEMEKAKICYFIPKYFGV